MLKFLLWLLLASSGSAQAALPDCKSAAPRPLPQESYSAFYARIQRRQCQKNWAVLVFMEADNDLYPQALQNLSDMEAPFAASGYAGSTPRNDLLVEVHSPKEAGRRLHIFETATAGAATNINEIHSPVVAQLTSPSSTQAQLEEFLLWGAARYPAKHYLVIVWGHGQGWKAYPASGDAMGGKLKPSDLPATYPSSAPDSSFGGIAFSGTQKTWLDIPALRAALQKFREAIGHPVDVYASDACLMQMLEVSYELKDEARFVVGSTQIQNFQGFPYRRILYELNSGRFNGARAQNRDSVDASDEPYLVAKMIPALARASLDPVRGSLGRSQREAQRWITASSLSMPETKILLLPALKNLGQALTAYLEEDSLRGLDLQLVMRSVPNFEGGAQDLGVFFSFLSAMLAKDSAHSAAARHLGEAVNEASDALDRAVTAYAYGSAYGVDDITHLTGAVPRALSIWLPISKSEYALRRAEFALSSFYRDAAWANWLDLVYPR